MNDYLVVLGQKFGTTRSEEVYKFMRHADGVLACCHVADAVYGIRTDEGYPELFARMQQFVGAGETLVVAPVSQAWAGQNATSMFKCFRSRDDDD
jgi:hypothetical protein